ALSVSFAIVVHLQSDLPSLLADVLDQVGPLPAAFAVDGEQLEHGRIYVAPPDRHLLVRGGELKLSAGPWENRTRPAIDPLFRSAALSYGPRVIGVVLTGFLDDGSSGLRAIKRCGGITVVQDPADAEYPDMPMNALSRTQVDHLVSLRQMPDLLRRLVAEPAGKPVEVPADIRLEVEIAAE